MTPKNPRAASWEAAWLPRRPLSGREKSGPYRRRPRDEALTDPLIEANPLVKRSLVIVDVDTTEIEGLTTLLGLPHESWAVRRRGPVGTGHLGWALTAPVCLTDAARRRPVRLLARIETGLTDVLGADTAYTGRITRNPIHPGPHRHTLWDQDHETIPTYSLRDLATPLEALGALPAWDDPRPRKSSGIGRNVDIFDRTRSWGYRAIRRYWTDDPETWAQIVEARATMLNHALENESRQPLPAMEIHHLSRSIAKWIWKRFTPETFSKIQSTRAKISGPTRQKKSANIIQEALNGNV